MFGRFCLSLQKRKENCVTYAPINVMPAGGGEAGHRVGI